MKTMRRVAGLALLSLAPAGLAAQDAPLAALDADVRDGRYGYVDALYVVHGDRVLLDERYEHDYRAASAGYDPAPHQYDYHHPDFHPYPAGRDVHTLQSITKSITSALIGIAIGRGEIESVEAPILDFLGDYDLTGVDPRLREATLEDVLTMRTGIEWHETDRPADSTNTTIQLEASDDWVRFTLDQPMDAEPGEKWVYNSGTSHLMSAILRAATGRTAAEYAEAHLFGPLGIEDYHWKHTPTGLPDTEGGLYLETADVARIGRLFLDGGRWEGRQVVPAAWVEASVARQVEHVNPQGWGYGYQWWRLDRGDTEIWAGLGYGGQYLLVMPGHDVVAVANSWNLFGPTERQILPALIDAIVRAADGAGRTAGRGQTLDYGPYAAGFTIIEALDSTRAFRPLRDFRGVVATEPARPIQISVWYPSASTDDARVGERMRAGDFRVLRGSELAFDREVGPEERRRMRAEFIEQVVEFGGDSAAAAASWDDRLPLVRDAPADSGPHPTVLYFTGAGVSNPTLPTYLASHGFVVASFPSNGRMTEGTLEFTPNALTLDTDASDAGFVYGVLRRLPYADTDRLAVVSFSGGSLASLVWVMRDMQAAAVVTVEGWERYRRGADIVSMSVHYDPDRVRVPVLMIERAADEASPQYAKVSDVVAALRYADLTRVAFRDASHGDFLSHAAFGHTEDQPRIFATSARMIRGFLEGTIGMEPDVGATAGAAAGADTEPPAGDDFFSIETRPSIGRVPSEEELFRMAERDPEAATLAYREATAIVPGRELFREAVLTRAASFASGDEARATIMRIVVDAYPGSTQARFRLAEALRDSGRGEEAAEEFRVALDGIDSDPSLSAAERADWRGRVRTALAGED